MGAKWRVGDGLSIRIFKDNWLPGVAGGGVISVPTDLNNSMRVAELIDRNLGWWNTWVIDETFVPFEAQRIKVIPLCETPQSDLLYWALAKDGVYSVKSGYKGLCEEARREEASGSNSATGFWSSIWKLQVPGKVKHFLWKACSNNLPTKQNLVKRKMLAERCATSVVSALKTQCMHCGAA